MTNDNRISVGILGYGGRGSAMAKAISRFSDEIYVKAVAEPEENRRLAAINDFGVPAENTFCGYNEFLKKGVFVDLLIITTMDTFHYEPLMKAFELGYKNILLEKPISPLMEECIEMTNAAKKYNANVIVLHSLRYNLYYRKLKQIIESGEIGEVLGIRHIEGAGLMNYSHSFVRGNWANTRDAAPLIMQKSCHDTDIITYITGKKYKKISSFGSLKYFTKENAPEGCAERCVECKYQDECRFSAVPMYKQKGHEPWYDSAVTKYGYSSAEEAMTESEYGRCVYKCDNNVMDNQVMNFEFEDGTTGTFTVTAFEFGRRTEVQGSRCVIRANEAEGKITIYDQMSAEVVKVYDVFSESTTTINHRSLDIQLTRDLIDFMKDGKSTDISFIDGGLHGHLACFAAEIAREEGRVVSIDELLK